MKRLFFFILTIPLLVSSCKVEPVAGFYTSEVEVDIQEWIYFTNNSRDARYYEWDFGDGTSSTDPSPAHKYTASGIYRVTLTAISKDNLIDRAYQDIEVLFPPLEILVLEWYDEYAVPGASVRLYPTLQDWIEETNMLAEGFTDSEGWVVFRDVGRYVYYVDVWEANHDNYTLAGEDVNFIRTPQLVNNDWNIFIAWVDYYPDGKKGEERDRDRRIKSPSGRSAGQKTVEVQRIRE